MCKLDLEKAEELQIKLPSFVGLWKKQGTSRKPSISASLTTLKPLCGSQQTVKLPMRANSLEKALTLGNSEGRRRRRQQRIRLLDGITDSVDMSLSKFWKIVKGRKPGVLQSMM